jgi:serine/threonine protein kinase
MEFNGQKRSSLVETREKRAELKRRLSLSLVMPALPKLPCCDFTAFPQYIHPSNTATDYIQEGHIGSVSSTQGAYGTVSLCRSRFSGAQFANKVVKVTSDFLLQGTVLEYETLSNLHHSNIVSVYGLWLEPEMQKASILLEFLPGKSLSQLLREEYVFTGMKYLEEEVKLLARQMLSVLLYLDSQGLAHRDVNPSNIILTESHATLIDFQTVCLLSVSSPQGVTGTPPYQAPEMWQSAGYGSKVDVWALGLVLKRLMRTAEAPMSAVGAEAVAWCLEAAPERRCSAAQALECSWLL